MSDGLETPISTYLTRCGRVFLAPQYNIKKSNSAGEQETSCPDFVVVDCDRGYIVVVEVTTSSNLSRLAPRIKNRIVEWFEPIRGKLAGTPLETLKLRFLGFVRAELINSARRKFSTEEDVTFFPLEKAVFDWMYWNSRLDNGLPDRKIASSMTEHEWPRTD